MGTLISEVVELLEPEAAKHGVEILFRDGLNQDISLDGQQIHRVLLNLVKNAIDALEDTGGLITIETAQEGDSNVIRVRDTGPGIPPEHLPKIGQAFFTTKEGRGTGLGLAVCFRIMEQHRGSMRVESECGEGTTFTLAFPDPCRTTATFRRVPA